jgi:hypothetical protein
MDSLGLIELILVFGAVLGFGFWELYSLRRDKKRPSRSGDDPPGNDSGN